MNNEKINVYDPPCPPTLASMIAVMTAAAAGQPVQSRHICSRVWNDRAEIPLWNWCANGYRIDPASKPKLPQKKVPCTAEDFQCPVIWIRPTETEPGTRQLESVVTGVNSGISVCSPIWGWLNFASLMSFEMSTDRKTWEPCYHLVDDDSAAS